jgi:hypothetical protein
MEPAARPKVDDRSVARTALAGSSAALGSVLPLPLFFLELIDLQLSSPHVGEAIRLEAATESGLD